MQTERRLSEDEMRAIWRRSIPKEFRPSGNSRRSHVHAWTPGAKERHAAGRQGVQKAKQFKYAAECTPVQDGDLKLLSLYAGGMSVQDVSREMELPYETTRLRIIACHPDAKGLR